jgi:hypothetical protein
LWDRTGWTGSAGSRPRRDFGIAFRPEARPQESSPDGRQSLVHGDVRQQDRAHPPPRNGHGVSSPDRGSRPLYIVRSRRELGSGRNREQIGRVITVSGAITEYRFRHGQPARRHHRRSDGNIWFTENGSNQIGRLSVVRGQTLETRFCRSSSRRRASADRSSGPRCSSTTPPDRDDRPGRVSSIGLIG